MPDTQAQSVRCPALFLSAPSSGQGKTTITGALARMLTRQGKVVRVFKTGPDYLDPQILEQASGQPVLQLDLWMAGEQWCEQQLFDAASKADLIIIEGAMGLFDGSPSSADLAQKFNIPLALIIDVKGMAQTAAAVAVGLANYRDDIDVVGLIANSCATKRHRELIESELPASLPLLGALARDESISLPERHLGLVQANEVAEELEQKIEAAADLLEQGGFGNIIERIKPIQFNSHDIKKPDRLLDGVRIGVAKDQAFTFIYSANIELLNQMGATVEYFSPINDKELPNVDALWLPGGYPELHANKLAINLSMRKQIQDFFTDDKPILAECGGMLYCLQTLIDCDEKEHAMLGLLDGYGVMNGKRGCQGMQSIKLNEGELRGHSHHRSRTMDTVEAFTHGIRQRHPAPGESVYRVKGLTASYLHFFFASEPSAVAAIFGAKNVLNTAQVNR